MRDINNFLIYSLNIFHKNKSFLTTCYKISKNFPRISIKSVLIKKDLPKPYFDHS